jgi:hypothetical protein
VIRRAPQERRPSAPGLAVLLVLAAACSGPRARTQPPPSTPLRADGPAGEIRYPFTFKWAGNSDAVVRVTVVDAAERRLVQFDARGQRAPMPAGLADMVKPGESFSWRVAAVDENGEPMRASAWVRCRRAP